VSYPEDLLFEEIALLASRLHWSLAEILDIEHPLRLRFVDELHRMEAGG
jgi:hypothetical protein